LHKMESPPTYFRPRFTVDGKKTCAVCKRKYVGKKRNYKATCSPECGVRHSAMWAKRSQKIGRYLKKMMKHQGVNGQNNEDVQPQGKTKKPR